MPTLNNFLLSNLCLKQGVRMVFLIISVLAISNCNKKEKIKKVDFSKTIRHQRNINDKNAIHVGIATILSPKEGFIYYQELLNYLGVKINRRIALKQGRYKEINELIRTGHLEVAFICSGPYVTACEKHYICGLIVPVIRGSVHYNSYIIVHRESKIKNFNHLKNKRFAFTDPLSTTGYTFPVYHLVKKGQNPRSFFSKYIFTHSHDNSIISVAEKIVDGASVDSLIWQYLAENRPKLIKKTKIIHKSPPFGLPGIVFSKKIDRELKSKIQKFFLTLHKEKKGAQIIRKLKIDRFVNGNKKNYDTIRKMILEVRKSGF